MMVILDIEMMVNVILANFDSLQNAFIGSIEQKMWVLIEEVVLIAGKQSRAHNYQTNPPRKLVECLLN